MITEKQNTKIGSILIGMIIFSIAIACNNSNKGERPAYPHSDTIRTWAIFTDKYHTQLEVGYIFKIVKDTFALVPDGNVFKKEWAKDTLIYLPYQIPQLDSAGRQKTLPNGQPIYTVAYYLSPDSFLVKPNQVLPIIPKPPTPPQQMAPIKPDTTKTKKK